MKQHGKKMLELMMGPTGSIILHIIIVIALVKLVHFATAPKEPEVEVVMMEVETVELEEIKEELEELKFEEKLDALTPPDMSVEMDIPDVADVPDVSEPVETDFAELDVVESVKSPLVMKGLYANRSAGGRKAALGAHGGSQATEAAVLRALEWLKNNQLEDGSWAPEKKKNKKGRDDMMKRSGYAGLALLAFLAHGELPGSGRYGETMEKAIRFIVDSQDDDGAFGGIAPDDGHGVYAHAIASYAISEAYGMTKIPTLRTAMNRAVELIIKGQQTGGGYDYYYNDEGRRDTGIVGWNIQALKAAKLAGCKVSGLQECIDKGLADLLTARMPDTGFFGYTDPATNVNNTGIAVLCFQLTGHGDGVEAREGMDALKTARVAWDEDADAWCMYGWYYITQAKFNAGGSDWTKWNREFSRVYVRNQNDDGSWDSPGHYEQFHGKPYNTALAALTLQVYYRHLPSYQVGNSPTGSSEEPEADDDEDEEMAFEVG